MSQISTMEERVNRLADAALEDADSARVSGRIVSHTESFRTRAEAMHARNRRMMERRNRRRLVMPLSR